MLDGKIVIFKAFKSENKNKTQIKYMMEDNSGNKNSLGLNEFEEWFDNSAIFDRLSREDILKPLEAKYTYVVGFNGTAKPKLLSIKNSSGNEILG